MKICRIFAPSNGGTVAQLVEQRTENPRVTGSIPVGTTKKETQTMRLFFLCGFSMRIRFLTQDTTLPLDGGLMDGFEHLIN